MVIPPIHVGEATDYQIQYDEYWAKGDHIVESSGDLELTADQIVESCGLGRTLDIGSGEGVLVASLLRRGVDAQGLDVSEVVVSRCNQRISNRFILGSVLSLPFADESFQIVVSTDCMEHLAPEDVPTALKEIHRVTSRYVFLKLATTQDRDADWHLTVEGRAWWEIKCFEAGFRKHPAYYRINSYESLNQDNWQIVIPLEKIPATALSNYPLCALTNERDLHMDMLREVGERSDAHVIRYQWAATYIRQGDRVLDAACGLGYGSYFFGQMTSITSVTGIDGSEYGIDYARQNFASMDKKISFKQGYLPNCLSEFEDGYFDAIVSFETLEHVEDPEALLTEFERILAPGGRIIVSVPNDWSDETGEDPNPYHLHVYTLEKLKKQLRAKFLLEALFQQIASGCKTNEPGKPWRRMSRTLRQLPIDEGNPPPSEWWLSVAMKSPICSDIPYRESVYGYTTPPENLLQFERDYENPWLVRSMLEFHFRSTSQSVLRSLADKVASPFETKLYADAGAALAVIGYQILISGNSCEQEVTEFLRRLDPYINTPPANPHLLRWQVSHGYLAANLLKKIGMHDQALHLLDRVSRASIDGFNPSLGTKIIDAAFEAGILAAGRENIAQAREFWKRGIERAYALLRSPMVDFVGDMENPHEFPTIDAVEFLDSAVRCIKALRWTAPSVNRPLGQLYANAHENWKFTLDQRWSAIRSMERMIRDRDESIQAQARLIDEGVAGMNTMGRMIRDRDESIQAQARLIDEGVAGMNTMEQIIVKSEKNMSVLTKTLADKELELNKLRNNKFIRILMKVGIIE